MKRLMLMAAVALALPVAASAQEAPQGPARAQMMSTIEFLVKASGEFNATPEQVAKLEEIAAKFARETAKEREAMQKIRAEMQPGADRSALMMKMRPVREEMLKKDEAAVEEALKVLNADQQKYAKQVLETRKQEMNNRRGQRQNRGQIR